MEARRAAKLAVMHVIICKLNECAVDGDDELTMAAIKYLNGVDEGVDEPRTGAESYVVEAARAYADKVWQVLEYGMDPGA